jgi:hypothetical protein
MAPPAPNESVAVDEKSAEENENGNGNANAPANEKSDVLNTSPSLTSLSSDPALDGISEKALLRKLDYKLLPPLTLLYLLSFLDRSNGMTSLSLPPLTLANSASWQR